MAPLTLSLTLRALAALLWALALPAEALAPCPRGRATVTTHPVALRSSMHDVMVSLAAGSAAGSIGVGLAYPFDSLKTRIQERASQVTGAGEKAGMLEMMRIILAEEGVRGFYNGVLGVMVGQAVIIGVAFTANSFALEQIASMRGVSAAEASVVDLIVASSAAGFVTAFVVNPIERIKIILQTDTAGKYSGQLDCWAQVLKRDGMRGLMFTGIDATLLREIPGYAVYFVLYTLIVRQEACAEAFGSFAPAAAGAIAGVLSWIPIYPFDVVKTKLQNNMGSAAELGAGSARAEDNFASAFAQLYHAYGAAIFFEGIGTKLVRAAINHSADFYFYDLITRAVSTPGG